MWIFPLIFITFKSYVCNSFNSSVSYVHPRHLLYLATFYIYMGHRGAKVGPTDCDHLEAKSIAVQAQFRHLNNKENYHYIFLDLIFWSNDWPGRDITRKGSQMESLAASTVTSWCRLFIPIMSTVVVRSLPHFKMSTERDTLPSIITLADGVTTVSTGPQVGLMCDAFEYIQENQWPKCKPYTSTHRSHWARLSQTFLKNSDWVMRIQAVASQWNSTAEDLRTGMTPTTRSIVLSKARYK